MGIPQPAVGSQRAEGTRMCRRLEPLAADAVRVVMAFQASIPAIIRWMVTDRVLNMAMTVAHRSIGRSWGKTLKGLDASKSYKERLLQEVAFYGPLDARTAACLERQRKARDGNRTSTSTSTST